MTTEIKPLIYSTYHRRLNCFHFPDPPERSTSSLPGTINNLTYILEEHGYKIQWDVISKKLRVTSSDGSTGSINELLSLSALNNYPSGNFYGFIMELGKRNPVNPAEDWIMYEPWDRENRLPAFFDTVQVDPEYDTSLKSALLYRWLLSIVAAARKKHGFHTRGVLTLQGPQGCGKTRWIAQLIPEGELRDTCVKLDHHLDGASKDSIIIAMNHWIVEIGELESSFRKDVARLKGVLTRDCDKLRPPYGRVVEDYPRRTVFAATVNDSRFLIDNTGNTRWWTIPVEKLDFTHTINMQQVFAQLAVDFDAGVQWWLTAEEEVQLNAWNKHHQTESAIVERVRDFLEDGGPIGHTRMTPSQLLKAVGVQSPTNPQCKEVGQFLREIFGPPKRVQGRDVWAITRISRVQDDIEGIY